MGRLKLATEERFTRLSRGGRPRGTRRAAVCRAWPMGPRTTGGHTGAPFPSLLPPLPRLLQCWSLAPGPAVHLEKPLTVPPVVPELPVGPGAGPDGLAVAKGVAGGNGLAVGLRHIGTSEASREATGLMENLGSQTNSHTAVMEQGGRPARAPGCPTACLTVKQHAEGLIGTVAHTQDIHGGSLPSAPYSGPYLCLRQEAVVQHQPAP
jgi:hypothetical protein